MAEQNIGRERQRLTEVYAGMEDGELEKLASEAATLSDVAREALRAELSKRKIHVALQITASAERQQEDEHPALVTIRKFLDIKEAQLARSLLESAGIPCFLADENTIRMNWLWSNALDGVKLWVRENDAAAAEEILDHAEHEESSSSA